ncbi:hypothetical protein Dfri01_25760 [Dyadobacter frigoris]|uniref:hypothetical protein n=1 Tax=Dyadobacter frigoris TaxID=2576211 RepID=UPI0024A3E21E|nr:hypothetical protein [Dyadobacter frigoris]GLU53115.1 hypothetical protein Dfri01_25760 [Dyadobacter frigoris]
MRKSIVKSTSNVFMKVLIAFGVIIFSLLLLVFIYLETLFFPLPFIVGKFGDKFEVKDVSRDTVFGWDRFTPFVDRIKSNTISFGIPFTITAKGNIDDSAEVYFQYVGHPGNSSYTCILPKGKVDTIFYGEIYADECEVVYSHENVKNGNLKVSFELGRHKK